jgi:hypothetical protein
LHRNVLGYDTWRDREVGSEAGMNGKDNEEKRRRETPTDNATSWHDVVPLMNARLVRRRQTMPAATCSIYRHSTLVIS